MIGEWFGLLKRRGRGMSSFAKEEVDKIMRDGQQRTMTQIHDELFSVVERKSTITTLEPIPTRTELTSYLRGSKNYNHDGKGNWTYSEGDS